jgi:hypothetical protein
MNYILNFQNSLFNPFLLAHSSVSLSPASAWRRTPIAGSACNTLLSRPLASVVLRKQESILLVPPFHRVAFQIKTARTLNDTKPLYNNLMGIMERIQRSWELAMDSWAVLKTQPSLLILPFISGVITLVVTATFFLPVVFRVEGMPESAIESELAKPEYIAWLALFYLVSYFIVIFFNSAVIYCAYRLLHGHRTSVGEGLSFAFKRIGAIFAWALIAATVGMVLRLISERFEWLGRLVIALIGAAWNLITYFVVPVMVVEGITPFGAIKRSAGMLRKTWGENIIGNVGIGLVFGLLSFLGVIPILIGVMTGTAFGLVVGIVIAVVYWIILSLVSSALSAIYQTALYIYGSTGTNPRAFSASDITDAFRAKEEKKGWF